MNVAALPWTGLVLLSLLIDSPPVLHMQKLREELPKLGDTVVAYAFSFQEVRGASGVSILRRY